MNKAKESQLQNAADTATEWFTKQYELATLGTVAGDPAAAYTTFVNNLTDKKLPTAEPSDDNLTPEVLKAAGVTDTTGLSGSVHLKNGKVCIKLTADGKTSPFYVNGSTINNTVSGSGC